MYRIGTIAPSEDFLKELRAYDDKLTVRSRLNIKEDDLTWEVRRTIMTGQDWPVMEWPHQRLDSGVIYALQERDVFTRYKSVAHYVAACDAIEAEMQERKDKQLKEKIRDSWDDYAKPSLRRKMCEAAMEKGDLNAKVDIKTLF